jgi:prepilin-type N-terminal cleavage/methylation domain-containing protein
MKNMRRKEKGFTLMELMVVIVIVAILAAVAVPLYINYVKDAQRTEAKGAIGAVITAQQTYYQQFGEYTDDTFVANPEVAGTQKLNCDLTDALNNWTITTTKAADPKDGFTVEAIGSGTSTTGLRVAYTFSRTDPPDLPWDESAPASP